MCLRAVFLVFNSNSSGKKPKWSTGDLAFNLDWSSGIYLLFPCDWWKLPLRCQPSFVSVAITRGGLYCKKIVENLFAVRLFYSYSFFSCLSFSLFVVFQRCGMQPLSLRKNLDVATKRLPVIQEIKCHDNRWAQVKRGRQPECVICFPCLFWINISWNVGRSIRRVFEPCRNRYASLRCRL